MVAHAPLRMSFIFILICVSNFRNPNWWPRRTALEKSLIVISILALIGIIVLVLSLSGVLVKKKECESKYKLNCDATSHGSLTAHMQLSDFGIQCWMNEIILLLFARVGNFICVEYRRHSNEER